MAADVSRQIKSEAQFGLTTRDFLSGFFGIESKEFDLDLHVPVGWEKRLDLQSGKVYVQRSNPTKSASEQRISASANSPILHDLNTLIKPSINTKPTLNLLEEPSLDLNLLSNNSASSTYASVCTLEKVKSALDRVERASPTTSWSRKRPLKSDFSPSPSNSSSLSAKGVAGEDEPESSTWTTQLNEELLVAAACPCCLLYVLISENDPKCPKCCSVVHLPRLVMSKKPKIDLNI